MGTVPVKSREKEEGRCMMGGGWKLVNRDVAVATLRCIHGLSQEEAEGLHDSFVKKYGRQPMISEVKVGLGYTGDKKMMCRIGAKSATYKDSGSFINTCQMSDGRYVGQRAVKKGDGWVYTELTAGQIAALQRAV